ncbi:class I SAM-dependent methyltransferase [Streptomyces sp. NPDC005438]|uniref:class I SAM-dependent methyltransferase n=1 Tax=Streptomyces sp. NPDC005438 TaxID=3156880 RepID=UPI0033B2917A
MATRTPIGANWHEWQKSWDLQQQWYLPDREERFRVMLDLTEALAGDAPRVLDLACGTGSITARVLDRFPGARCVGVDLDPALLTIARGTFEGEPRAEFHTVDLLDPRWRERLPGGTFDVVLTATALHWLRAEPHAQLYRQLAELLPTGGVFLNADHMPDQDTPRIGSAVDQYETARREAAREAGSLDWADWWRQLADDPALAEQAEARFRVLGDPRVQPSDHAHGEIQSLEWHLEKLREAGFDEVRAVWRSITDACVLGLK